MGVLSIAVLSRVDRQVDTLTALNNQTNQARQMIYEVTAQSHYRAMALLTGEGEYTDKIYAEKGDFVADLDEIQTNAIPPSRSSTPGSARQTSATTPRATW